MSSLFLEAFKGNNRQIPVWFMRQAGRSLPQYQTIKQKYSLEEMFKTPELAAKITCMPIDILGVDAAILFADILTLPTAMGFKIRFDNKEGPVIDTNFKLSQIRPFQGLPYLSKTIHLVNQSLPPQIPLIGFAGSPFTVLTYLIEGGSSTHFSKTIKFMQSEPKEFHQLMKLLTENTVSYLKFQKKAGIKAFQLFDTWAGILRKEDYEKYVLRYVQKIFKSVDLPSIYYLKNCSHLMEPMEQSGADFLSVCHTVDLRNQAVLRKTKCGIQGNLYNGLLYADTKVILKETHHVLNAVKQYQRYIFNLSHGIPPDADWRKLKTIVEAVHQFPWDK
jgi:uroporphyrinogen decarboxylase